MAALKLISQDKMMDYSFRFAQIAGNGSLFENKIEVERRRASLPMIWAMTLAFVLQEVGRSL